MSNESLSNSIAKYVRLLADGEVQATYQNLVRIVQNLRTDFAKNYKDSYSVAGVMHGYLDFTYFYLQNDYLKKHKLKFAIVLNHQKADFELWLLGQTKAVQRRYWQNLKSLEWVDEDQMPEYSIFEVPLLANPDFDDLDELPHSVICKFDSLSNEILERLYETERKESK